MAHSNPFNDKCIHGKEGAIIVRGLQTNPKCDLCTPVVIPKKGEKK